MANDSQPVPPPPPPEERCAICGNPIPPTGNYCPNCGAIKPSMTYAGLPSAGDRRAYGRRPLYYQSVQRRSNLRLVLKTISAMVVVSFVLYLAVELVALIWGTQNVIPDILHTWDGYSLFVVVPFIVDIVKLSGNVLLGYYFFLIIAIVASCLWVVLSSMPTFVKEVTGKAESRKHSPLFDTMGLLFATLFFSILIALISQPSSGEAPAPSTLSESLFLLANASVWEEIAVRVLLIGIPLLIIDSLRKKTKRGLHRYLLGGGFQLGTPEVVLMVASAAIFGIAHFISGWGAWKIVPAAAGGLAFGFLFLRYGLAASITMHFATDYLSMPYEVYDSLGLQMLVGLALWIWVAFGVIFFIYYLSRIYEYLTKQLVFEPRPAPPAATWVGPGVQVSVQPPPPPVYYAPPPGYAQPSWPPQQPPQRTSMPHVSQGIGGGYVCPVCGNTEARWVDGRFQCLRCGHLS